MSIVVSCLAERLYKIGHDVPNDYSIHYGWHGPLVEGALEIVEREFADRRRIINVACGCNRLSEALNMRGRLSHIQGYDNGSWGQPMYGMGPGVIQCELEDMPIENADAVILSWAPYCETLDLRVFERMSPGAKLLLIGESDGGCTGSDDGWMYLAQHFHTVVEDEAFERFVLGRHWVDEELRTWDDFVHESPMNDTWGIYQKGN